MSENIVTANEKYALQIGKDYANANNEVQANLLNGMFGQLRYVCQGSLENQLCYIWSELDRNAKEALVKLAAFAEFD